MKIGWHVVLTALAGLTALASPAGAQTQEIQDAVVAMLAEAKPAPKSDDKAEAKPLLVPETDYLDFVFVASDRPVLLRLHLRNDGRPYLAAWNDYMRKLYAYLDRNGDGVLDKAEAERIPSIRFLQFQLQGAIGLPYQGSKGQLAQFDTNKDGKVSLGEFKTFYRRGGFTPLRLVSNSNRVPTDTVTNTIFKRLDSNQDGKLSADEMARAPTALQRFDLDENEMLTADELMPGGGDNSGFYAPPSGGMQGPNADMGFVEIKPGAVDGAASQVLTHYDKDKNGKLSRAESGLDKLLFDALDSNHDGQLDVKEFAAFFRRNADLELVARVGTLQAKEGAVIGFLRDLGMPALQMMRAEVFNPSKRAMPLATKLQRVDSSAVAFSLGDAHIGLAAAEQQLVAFPRRFFEQQFRMADAATKGVVDRKQAKAAQFLDQIFEIVDRDGDGKVTRLELKAYLDMQTEGSSSRLDVTITEEGPSLFNLLDENGDGRLSLRELRTAWSRMKALAKSDSGLSRPDIPRRFDVLVGPAQRRVRPPASRPANPTLATRWTSAPLWFQKMDRNQDGDISPREFVAGDEAFRKIDTDGDGLISREEARRFEERLKK